MNAHPGWHSGQLQIPSSTMILERDASFVPAFHFERPLSGIEELPSVRFGEAGLSFEHPNVGSWQIENNVRPVRRQLCVDGVVVLLSLDVGRYDEEARRTFVFRSER